MSSVQIVCAVYDELGHVFLCSFKSLLKKAQSFSFDWRWLMVNIFWSSSCIGLETRKMAHLSWIKFDAY